MNHLSLQECCRLFAIDPKTLRQWLAQAQISLQTHPRDARVKCLSDEQVHLLARLHDLTISSDPFQIPPSRPESTQNADMQERLVHLEAQVATLQTQLTDLALQLLRERQFAAEQHQLVLHLQQRLEDQPSIALPLSAEPFPPAVAPLVRHPTEKRNRLVPLIEYGAGGRYVLICPEEGELRITPDSPEWFAWLTSLSSFRFVGQAGRFSARRGYNRRPNRGWYAQRTIHQQFHGKYLGVSEHITIARLEQIAAHFQSYLIH